MAEETIESMMEKGKDHFEKAIEHLQNELLTVRAGKASPAIVHGVMVDAYGAHMPINQVANVSTSDARTIVIQPFDKSVMSAIERAIINANLGINPQNDGEMIRLSIPPLTEERRRDLVKQSKHFGEEAKVSLRQMRHKLLDFIKKEVKDGYPEDAGKRREQEVDDWVHKYTEMIDTLIKKKEEDIMTV